MKITYNVKNIDKINEISKLALIDTTEAIKTDLIQSQVMPFKTGVMQNDSTYCDYDEIDKGKSKIVTDTPYARKVYFDPDITINTDKNPNAKQHWFDEYIEGNKKNISAEYYQKALKRRMK